MNNKKIIEGLEKLNKSWIYNNLIRRMRIYSMRADIYCMKKRHVWKRNFPILAIASTLILAFLFVRFFPFTSYAAWNLTNTGQIGDTVGGLTAPIIGLLNAILLWWTLKVQNDQINSQNDARNYEKRIQLIDENINRCKLSVIVAHSGPHGHSERKTYNGIEALIRATDLVSSPESINMLRLDPIEWKAFLKSVEGVYRNMSVAVDINSLRNIAGSHDTNDTLDQDIKDLLSQTQQVLEFAISYIFFMDQHRSNQNYEILRNEDIYHVLKYRYGWAVSYMAAINGDIQDEPSDHDGDGPED